MGLIHVTVTMRNLKGEGEPYEAEFLVDTGAIDCLAPSSELRRAEIAEEGREVYELANGEIVEYPFGFARVSFLGSETVSKVIFGPDDCEPLLGVTVLESVGIAVDPVTRGLKRMSAKPLKMLGGYRDESSVT